MNDEPATVIDICEHCGASTKKYWYRITPGLIDVLLILLDYVHETGANEFTQKDVRANLKTFQYTQLTKLRFHGLIAKIKDDAGVWHGGWLITSRAARFLRNEITIPAKVQTYRNKVVGHDDLTVTAKDVYKSDVYLEGREEFIRQPLP